MQLVSSATTLVVAHLDLHKTCLCFSPGWLEVCLRRNLSSNHVFQQATTVLISVVHPPGGVAGEMQLRPVRLILHGCRKISGRKLSEDDTQECHFPS
jgi:hypothetical protein